MAQPIVRTSAEPWWLGSVRCPDCGGALVLSAETSRCAECEFERPHGGQLDLRPRRPRRTTQLTATLGTPETALARVETATPASEVTAPAGTRDSSSLFSALRAAEAAAGRLLDLGCGPRDQVGLAERLGYSYVGADLDNPAADLLADAQALPFASATFDVVLAYAVLEHVANPWLGASEVARVLGGRGYFVGTVSQGEPFHASFFHATAWGLETLLAAAGLELIRLWPSYDTLGALARMGEYPRALRGALATLAVVAERAPWLAPRAPRDAASRRRQAIRRAASLCFLARKSVAAAAAGA